MDLGFRRFERDVSTTALPPDLAMLLVAAAARQATSPTAMINARAPSWSRGDSLLAPSHGAFSKQMADWIAGWHEE